MQPAGRPPRSSLQAGSLLGPAWFVAISALLPSRFRSLAFSLEGMARLVFLLFGVWFLLHGVGLAYAVDAAVTSRFPEVDSKNRIQNLADPT